MTWPMHDAGSTTPDPGREEARRQEARREPWPEETQPWPEEPWPEETQPWPQEPAAGSGDADPPRRGRHAAAPDPLPPIEGQMPGGGPSPAETTLPLALKWPAPPARPHRSPPPGPPGSPGAPPGWRRVPRTTGYPPPRPAAFPAARLPPRPPGAPGPPGPPGGGPGGPGAGARPPGSPGSTATQRSSLVRSGAGMAVGTLVSRATGFLRTLVLVYALGTLGLGNAYNNANTLPNSVYYLMLGGIFTSVVVPLLVRAARRDPDRGEAYAQRLFTLGTLALLAVTVVATLLAAPLVDLTAPTIHGAEHNLMVVWAYFFIPQIFFYGISSLIGAILNTRGRFAAPMWAPVVNNLVVIVIGGLYVATVGLNKDPSSISAAGVQLLGIGTTLGVVAQTVALFPSLRAAGFRWRPTLGFRPGEVTEMGRMAGWMSVYVIATWVGNLIAQIVANVAAPGRNGYSAYAIRLAALPAALRDHRHLGDHGAAAPDERARQRAPVLAGQGRLLDRRPAGLRARGPGGDLPRRARRAAGRVPVLLRQQHARGGEIHRRGLRPVRPRPGALHAHPAAAAGLLLVPGQPDRRLGRPAHDVRQHRGRPHRAARAGGRGRGRRDWPSRTGSRTWSGRSPAGRCCCAGSAASTGGRSPGA